MENLPDLTEVYPLTQNQIESYRRDGHILLQSVTTREEANAYRPFVQEVVEQVVKEKDRQARIDDYNKIFLQVTNLWRKSEAVRRFVFARRFAKVAAELIGVDGVRLYHDQALFKEPGGHPTPWHQDYYYWPLDTDDSITMWMPLVDVSKEMGSMTFVSGVHKEGVIVDLPISDESQEFYERFIAEKDYPLASYDLRAGDCTFHSGLMLHSGHGNSSNQMREVMTIIYFADGTRLMEPDNEFRKVDMEVFHPGQKSGEVAASPFNPLLYYR